MLNETMRLGLIKAARQARSSAYVPYSNGVSLQS
jgi:hypothetical protein